MRYLVSCLGIICLAAPTWAQVGGYVSFGGGGQLTAAEQFEYAVERTSDGTTLPEGSTARIRTVYRPTDSGLLDFGGGGRFGRIGIGVHYTRTSMTHDGFVNVGITEPSAAQEIDQPLERSEDGVHIQLSAVLPVGERFEVTVFGGPSWHRVEQQMINEIEITEDTSGPTFGINVAVTGLQMETDSAWGYNVGADATFYLTDLVGVGGGVRFTEATVALPDLLAPQQGGSVESKTGGTQLTGGVRLRF